MWDAPAPLGFCGSRRGAFHPVLGLSCKCWSGFPGPSFPGRVRSVLLRAGPRCRNGRAPEPLMCVKWGAEELSPGEAGWTLVEPGTVGNPADGWNKEICSGIQPSQQP